ncbi:hypothetical protein HXP81_003354 [Salmonella enterica]|nr:hypothetical protein [Salmonella enterica]EIV4812169.1 hypothetical protein [Salmonella enterica]EME7020147.1 hypothetical protein [Salmonella enterica]
MKLSKQAAGIAKVTARGASTAISTALLLTLSMPATANPVSVTVPVTATFVAPTCTLTVPVTHNIGSMMSGSEASYSGLSIGINCGTDTVTSRLYASVLGGTVVDGTTVKMDGAGSVTSANPPVLRMLDGVTPVALDGSGASSDSSAFCAGSVTRDCVLTPRVSVPANASPGSAKASLRFTLRYS